MKTTVVIPTYNEAANIQSILQALMQLRVKDLFILVVDDNSPDGTAELAEEMQPAYPERIEVLRRPGKGGLGSAYCEGFARAIEAGSQCIVQMDADFSHSPRYIPRFLKKISEYDVIVGSRYAPGGKLDESWSWSRYLLSWWANSVYVRSILGLRVHDATAGFKMFTRSAIQKIDMSRVRSNGYVFQVEMAYLSEQEGLRILEWPIYFEDRRIGRSKMTMTVKLEAAYRVWEIRSRYGRIKSNAARVDTLREKI